MNRYVIAILLAFAFGPAFAHQDFWITKDFDNVKVRIKTGFKYEEINKVFIIGQLAAKLSKEFHYTEQVFLDFNHHYTGDCEPDYFISFDKGDIEETWTDASARKSLLKKNSIVIRQVSRQFDTEKTLKLVEYSIHNVEKIKTSQKRIDYYQNFCQWKINTMDTLVVQAQLAGKASPVLLNVIQTRINRSEEDFKCGVSYYWQDNQYVVFVRDYYKKDTIVAKLNNIYAFQRMNESSVVFDTDSTFYSFRQDKPWVSKKHTIENTFDYYRPYQLTDDGGNKISIHFYTYNPDAAQRRARTLIYVTDKDELMQDLDKLIDKR